MAIAGATKKEPIPAPLHDEVMPESGWDGDQRESAVFAGGCECKCLYQADTGRPSLEAVPLLRRQILSAVRQKIVG